MEKQLRDDLNKVDGISEYNHILDITKLENGNKLIHLEHDDCYMCKCENCERSWDISKTSMYYCKGKTYCHICIELKKGIELDIFYTGNIFVNEEMSKVIAEACWSFFEVTDFPIKYIDADLEKNIEALCESRDYEYIMRIIVRQDLKVMVRIRSKKNKGFFIDEEIDNYDFSCVGKIFLALNNIKRCKKI
jgi:hypothetical protein